MTSIVEKINFFKENLELFDDDMDKYKYLIENIILLYCKQFHIL